MTSKKNTPEKAAETACEAPDVEAVSVPSETPDKAGEQAPAGAENASAETVLETRMVAAATGLNLRSGPGKVYPVVKVLPNKTVVTLTGGSVELGRETWLSVDDGKTAGWVDSTWLCS